MGHTAVIGTTFVDLKGFARNTYDPQGRNLGEVKIVHGGVGRNVVENFANVGMPVSYVGMLEDSAIGRDVERHLREIGADLTHMVKAPENGIGMWLVILDEKGNQAGSISKMPDIRYLEDYLREKGEEIISGAETVVLEVDLNEQIAERIVGLAGKYRKPVYSIVGNLSVVLARKDLIRRTNCFICNEIEAGKYFGNPAVTGYTPEEMLAFLPEAARQEGLRAMVVTMGEKGAVYYDGNTLQAGFCPPCEAEVVDATGAGDAFFSGTVMGLIRGIELPEAVKYGAKLAAVTISRPETNCPENKAFFDGKD